MSHSELPSRPYYAEYRLRDMCPPTSRSGEHRVVPRLSRYQDGDTEVSQVVDSKPSNELPRPIAKAVPVPADRRELLNEEARDRFCFAVSTLKGCGWSIDAVARYLGCTRTYLLDAMRGDRAKKHRFPAWLLDGLPEEVQGVIAAKHAEQRRKRAG
jgi:hypothetical protein